MTDAGKKSLMRNLGAFFGHVYKAIKTDPAKKRTIVSKTVEEEDRGSMTLRRTTIEEVEIKEPKADS
ncbi:MAG: hypothetical protein ACYS0D_01840 [Planctomycetota bacterium]|jgi:hypothetical protein